MAVSYGSLIISKSSAGAPASSLGILLLRRCDKTLVALAHEPGQFVLERTRSASRDHDRGQADRQRSGSGLFTWRMERPILPSRMLSTLTFTTSFGFKYSLMSWTYVSATSEMCTRPVFPSPNSTKAPKLVMPVTLPSTMLPTSMDIRKQIPPLKCCPARTFVPGYPYYTC